MVLSIASPWNSREEIGFVLVIIFEAFPSDKGSLNIGPGS